MFSKIFFHFLKGYLFGNTIDTFICLLSNGPKDWVFVSKFCAGDQQSLINLDTKTAVSNGTSGDLTFKKYDLINRENTNFENNGHTAELEVYSLYS